MVLSKLHIKKRCKKSPRLALALKSLGFTNKSIKTSFHMPNYILKIANRRSKLKTKNLDKKILYNSESRIKSLYIKLDIAIKISICQAKPISLRFIATNLAFSTINAHYFEVF